jgi:hypothetical protein
MTDHYPRYEAHKKFVKQFTAQNPPCFQCDNSAAYICTKPDCSWIKKHPKGHTHPCDCIQSGYLVVMEDQWHRRCKENEEGYTFGGWRIKNPQLAPGQPSNYRGRKIPVDELLNDPRYEKYLAGLDDEAMEIKSSELIYGTKEDRDYLEHQTATDRTDPKRKLWHLVGAIPWCSEHDRPMFNREGTSEYGAYSFYSCPEQVGDGYCKVKVNARDL